MPIFKESASKLTGITNPFELKSSRLLGTARGRRELKQLISEIFRNSLGVIFVVMDKKCFASHTFVTYFLDSGYTPGLGASWLSGDEIHEATQKVCNHFPMDILKDFIDGFQSCDVEKLLAVRAKALAIVNGLPARGRGILPFIAGITREIIVEEIAGPWNVCNASKGQTTSPNFSAFFSAFGLIARHASRYGIQRPQIVHDRQVEFEPIFKAYQKRLAGGADAIIDFGKGAPIASGEAAKIDLTFQDSKTSPGLVAADLIAGMVRWATVKLLTSDPVPIYKDQSEVQIVELLSGLVFHHDVVSAKLGSTMPYDFHAIISDNLRSKMWQLGKNFKPSSL